MQARTLKRAEEYRIICPHCNSLTSSGKQVPKCYVNEDKECYHCFHCGASGHISELENIDLDKAVVVEKKEFDSSVLETLPMRMPEKALQYLERRFPGLPAGKLINIGDVRWCEEKQAIALPTRNFDGVAVGVKYRMLGDSGIRWVSEPGSKAGSYVLEGNKDKLLVVEGQFDALTAKLCGFEGTVIALESTNLPAEVINKFKEYSSVFIMLDADGPGSEAQSKIAQDLSYMTNLSAVKMPAEVKDLNEALQSKGKESVTHFIQNKLKSSNEKLTIRLSERLDKIYSVLTNEDARSGKPTGWTGLDMILDGGLRESDYTIINSYMKSGKTTFVNNLAFNHICQGKKVALASFEMDPDSETFIGAINLAGNKDVLDIPASMVTDHVSRTLIDNKWLNNLIVYNKHGKTMWDEVRKWLDYVVGAYEIDLVILDHAGFMVKDMKDATQNINLHANAKQFAVETKVPTVMVTQTSKPAKDKFGNRVGDLDMYSSYGGTGAGIACNHYITLKIDEDAKNILKVKLAGSRNRRALIGEQVLLEYDKLTGKLTESYDHD